VIDYLSQPLVAHARVITVKPGGALAFHLDAGPAHAARGYWLLGSVSGTRPGLAIPGSKAVLPLNWDPFTDVLVRLTNTSYCDRFLGALDAQGRGLAILRHRGAMPPSMAGAALDFAYVLFPGSGRGWFVSNPLEVTVVP